VLRTGSSPTAAQAALGILCEIYWHPIYGFIRSSGHDAEDAADLTQRFVLYLVEQEVFARADRAKGKLRSYLLRILKRFLAHVRRQAGSLVTSACAIDAVP
jgi:RNA polymerase sigma-70 factor (ECF subfamily)